MRLLDRAATIVNRYGIMIRAGSSLMSIVGQDDFRRVLEHVRCDLAAYEKQIAEEVARARRRLPANTHWQSTAPVMK